MIDDERLIAAAKAALGDHYLNSDEEFLDWANENYYGEAQGWFELTMQLAARGTLLDFPTLFRSYLDYELIGDDLSHCFYMADGLVFFPD